MFESTMLDDNEQQCNVVDDSLYVLAFLPSVGFLLWLQEMVEN